MSDNNVQQDAVSSYGAEDEMPIGQDFYRALAPFVARVNSALAIMIMAMCLIVLCMLVWLGVWAMLTESYVMDGITACKVEPIQTAK